MIKLMLLSKIKLLKFIKNPDNYLKRKIKKIQKNKFFKNNYYLSVQLSSNKEIKLLNKKFRKKISQQIYYLFHIILRKNLRN